MDSREKYLKGSKEIHEFQEKQREIRKINYRKIDSLLKEIKKES